MVPNNSRSRRKARRAAHPVQRGRLAANKVYSIPELRQQIFSFVDQDTLPTLFRLEKSGVEMVAKILYYEVHIGKAWEMSRGDPRGELYCDAIRVLDISHPPGTKMLRDISGDDNPPLGPLDPDRIIKLIHIWRRKLPQIHTIRNDDLHSYLAGGMYTARLHQGGKLRVTMETSHSVDLRKDHFPASGIPVISPIENLDMVRVDRHIIYLTVLNCPEGFYPSPGHNMLVGDSYKDNLVQWARWISSGELDRRVAGLHYFDTSGLLKTACGIIYNYDEMISFITRRRLGDCESMKRIDLSEFQRIDLPSHYTFLHHIATPIGSALHTLLIDSSFAGARETWYSVIQALDITAPALCALKISSDRDPSFEDLDRLPRPLMGLRQLRVFTLIDEVTPSNKKSHAIALNICHLGSARCCYTQLFLAASPGGENGFNKLVKRYRNNLPRPTQSNILTERNE